MKGCFVFTLILFGMLGAPLAGTGFESHDVIEQKPNGKINWTRGTISAKGKALPDENESDKSKALQDAVMAAAEDARKNLIQLIKGIRVDSRIKAGDILVASETIRGKLNEILAALKPIEPINHFSDEGVAVELKMPLKGAFTQLLLPADIKRIEPIKQVDSNNSGSNSKNSDKSKATPPPPVRPKTVLYTGMIVDAKGLSEVQPAIVPKIVDESGQEIYGPAFASREYALQVGLSGYTRTLPSAENDDRIKDNPLIVKGLKTKDFGGSVIVVSNSDAAKLRQASEHLSFLRKCRVIIVLD